MGVEGLKGFFARNKDFKNAFVKNIPKDVSSLYIDCNSTFHGAAAKVYQLPSSNDDESTAKEKLKNRKKLMKRSRKNLEKLHIKTIIEKFESFLEEFKPAKNLILAVDGIANAAKLNQQKPRRFKKSVETVDPTVIIDTNCITPGTEFMIKLDKEIEKWLSNSTCHMPENVIYSSHLSPGEGEHKIFHYIRKGDLDTSGVNIILGIDNDLIILSMVSELKNFYMKPEDNSTPIFVDKLKEIIENLMEFERCDKSLLIKDFSVIMTLAGNDFLHKFPNVGKLNELISFLFLVYSKFLKKHLSDKNNKILWRNYMDFLIFYNDYKNSQGRGQKYIEILKKGVYKKNYPELEESILVTDKDGKRVNQVYNREIHQLKFDENLFSKLWYKKQFNPEIIQYNLKITDEYTKSDIVNMCINYLQTVQWVHYYYTEGFEFVSNLHFYHYLYNPLMSSVISVLKLLIKENKTGVLDKVKRNIDKIDITAVHQLMAVLPITSIDLIPEQFQKIYKKELKVINPIDFKISMEATYKDHQGLPILPKTNMNLIDTSLREKNFKLPEELQEKEDSIYKMN